MEVYKCEMTSQFLDTAIKAVLKTSWFVISIGRIIRLPVLKF